MSNNANYVSRFGVIAVARKEAKTELKKPRPVNNRKRNLVFAASGIAVVALCVALRLMMGSSPAKAQIPNPFSKNTKQQATNGGVQQPSGELPRVEKPQHNIMAVVNGQDINRNALGTACVERFGKDVLEGLVNKRLIAHY